MAGEVAAVDSDGNVFSNPMEIVLHRNSEALGQPANAIATAGKGTEPVTNKDQSRRAQTSYNPGYQPDEETFNTQESISGSQPRLAPELKPARLGSEEPYITEEDWKTWNNAPIVKGRAHYDKDQPIEQDHDAWTDPLGVMIHKDHPQLKDFPDEEYEKIPLKNTLGGRPVAPEYEDYLLVRPKKNQPVVGSLTPEQQQQMTHQAEQSNPAKPYVDFIKAFASGGLHDALKSQGIEMPEWSQAAADFFKKPEVQTALGMVNPLSKKPLLANAPRPEPLGPATPIAPEEYTPGRAPFPWRQEPRPYSQTENMSEAYHNALRDPNDIRTNTRNDYRRGARDAFTNMQSEFMNILEDSAGIYRPPRTVRMEDLWEQEVLHGIQQQGRETGGGIKIAEERAGTKFTVKKFENSTGIKQDYFHIINEEGEKIGYASISKVNGGKGVAVNSAYSNTHESWSLGTAATKSLIREIKREYPDAEYLVAYRATGARHGEVSDFNAQKYYDELGNEVRNGSYNMKMNLKPKTKSTE